MVTRQPAKEVKEQTEITATEIARYKAECEALPQKRIDGILISSRERYCISIGAMEVRGGEIIIKDAFAVQHVDRVDALVPRTKYHPPKVYWDDLKRFAGVIEGKMKAVEVEEEEFPF